MRSISLTTSGRLCTSLCSLFPRDSGGDVDECAGKSTEEREVAIGRGRGNEISFMVDERRRR